MSMYILILVIALIITIIIIISFAINYLTHLDMMRPNISSNSIVKKSFKEFKNHFYKKEWSRDLSNKTSFFDKTPNNGKVNYIHAYIVIIEDIKYRFTFLSFIKFIVFTHLNRTNSNNFNRFVNTKKDIRKQKLKKIGV